MIKKQLEIYGKKLIVGENYKVFALFITPRQARPDEKLIKEVKEMRGEMSRFEFGSKIFEMFPREFLVVIKTKYPLREERRAERGEERGERKKWIWKKYRFFLGRAREGGEVKRAGRGKERTKLSFVIINFL